MSTDRNNSSKKTLLGFVVACLTLPLAGCFSMHEPTTINQNKVQVKQQSILEDMFYDDIGVGYLDALAAHYRKHGQGPVDLLLTYDPESADNTAMSATNKVALLAASLRDRGVERVQSNIMPIRSHGEKPRVLIGYTSYTAHAPKGCDFGGIPGLNSPTVEHNQDYKLGCSIKTLVAKQVARPADLLGNGNTDTETDGRSATNIIDAYRTGAPNAELTGDSASGDD